MVAAVDGSSELERERDAILHKIITIESELDRGGTISKAEYLHQRHELEQRLIQVMDELTRLTLKG